MTKLKMIFIGIIAAGGALIIELLLISHPIDNYETSEKFRAVLIMASFIEEFIKFAFIGKVSQTREFKEKIFLNSFFFGSGFALTEIFFNHMDEQIFYFSAYSGLMLIHILTASLAGFYFSAGYGKLKAVLFFSLAILAHLAFNLAVLKNYCDYPILNLTLSALILFLCFLRYAFGRPKNLLQNY